MEAPNEEFCNAPTVSRTASCRRHRKFPLLWFIEPRERDAAYVRYTTRPHAQAQLTPRRNGCRRRCPLVDAWFWRAEKPHGHRTPIPPCGAPGFRLKRIRQAGISEATLQREQGELSFLEMDTSHVRGASSSKEAGYGNAWPPCKLLESEPLSQAYGTVTQGAPGDSHLSSLTSSSNCSSRF
jgi:hypothetical protein